METSKLKKFAQSARRLLTEQVNAKLKLVLMDTSAARREKPDAVKKLEQVIEQSGKDYVSEKIAYVWFNRFCALRYMDVNRYSRISVISPSEGQTQPEILAEAKMGHLDEEMISEKAKDRILGFLDGKLPSNDSQGEAYRLIIAAVCDYWHKAMPFLFPKIDDYTELLMPDDLLSSNSVIALTREAMTASVCEDVEVIGWLYQFYISEKKEEVFEALKKNKKITPANIPAATQLFTPHWIVRYVVDNSLGRLWMLNRPSSKLTSQMDFYIQPKTDETDFLRIATPEDLKICDPACGSGHMLVYAFDLLYFIYEEEGYEPSDIPEKILTHNLFGIEIDQRAMELAAFALTMKARAKQRRFFRNPVQPNVCQLENITFDDHELNNYMDFVGRNLFTAPFETTLRQFEEADNFGSLIQPELTDLSNILEILESKNVSSSLLLHNTHEKVLKVLRQVDFLRAKYDIVVANPPYMGAKGMNNRLASWAKEQFPESKSDLFSMFTERILRLVKVGGFTGLMTPFTWMFLGSYEKLRLQILKENTLTTLVRPEYHSFFESAFVPICAFTVFRKSIETFKGSFIDLQAFYGAENQPIKALEAIKNENTKWIYRASAEDLLKIPGSPIAYWLSKNILAVYKKAMLLGQFAQPRQGLATADNARFVRFWSEVSRKKIGFDQKDRPQALASGCKWFPYNKGGEYRKWYGNQTHLVNWGHDGAELENFKPRAVIRNPDTYFRESLSWSKVTSSGFSLRYFPRGFIYDVAGCSIFLDNSADYFLYLGLLNSSIMTGAVKLLSPTMNFEVGQVANFPILQEAINNRDETVDLVGQMVQIAKEDWDSYETSWDFNFLPLLNPAIRETTLEATYNRLRANWAESTAKMQSLEEQNNKNFIQSYGLENDLTPEVPIKEITLYSNPKYRYGTDKADSELEELLLSDTIKDLISYAVGCMFGRYSLEKPGLILANQDSTLADYLAHVPNSVFQADADNVIPLLEGDWFSDDISERFRTFLKITFGEKNYEQNLTFVENALGKTGKCKTIREYFLKDFYNDHLKKYKKRPIYWLFSSPKGTFNALVYLHRYKPDTVGVVLNDYLREFRLKLTSQLEHMKSVEISADVSKTDRIKALRKTDDLKTIIEELTLWEREVVYPLATEQIVLDLDDGVKTNYLKLGPVLKKIPGLDTED